MSTAPAQAGEVLGIIAGSGKLPLQLVDACQSGARPFFIIALEGYADTKAMSSLPHAVVRLGAVGEALTQLRRAGASELVLAGSVKRPSFGALRPDLTGARLLARLGAAFMSGDDAVLRSVIQFLEEEGFAVVAAGALMRDLLAPLGTLGAHAPSKQDEVDISIGLKVAKSLGEQDVGQAVIVENGYVLGVEAAEGTDALIARCRHLKKEQSRGGVLVKVCKPQQEQRADLPAIGPDTIEKIAACGFSGVAVQASASIILERKSMISKADALGVFVVGVQHAT
jgi:DUF1009 family protein